MLCLESSQSYSSGCRCYLRYRRLVVCFWGYRAVLGFFPWARGLHREGIESERRRGYLAGGLQGHDGIYLPGSHLSELEDWPAILA